MFIGPFCFLFDVYMSHCRTAGNDISIFLDVQHVDFLTIKLPLTYELKDKPIVVVQGPEKIQKYKTFHSAKSQKLEEMMVIEVVLIILQRFWNCRPVKPCSILSIY